MIGAMLAYRWRNLLARIRGRLRRDDPRPNPPITVDTLRQARDHLRRRP